MAALEELEVSALKLHNSEKQTYQVFLTPRAGKISLANILFLTSTLPRFVGDQQAAFVLEQAAAWKRARPDDTLYILAPHDVGAHDTEQIDSVTIERFHYMRPAQLQTLAYPAIMPNLRRKPVRALQIPFYLWNQYRTAKRMIKTHRIDLVYAHWVMPQGVVADQLKRATGVPYILQNHSSDLSVFTKLGKPGRALARRILRRAEAFFCVNSLQREMARDILPGLACAVLPMGVAMQTPKAPPVTRATDAAYGVGTISRLSGKKGLDHLIAAAEALAARGQHPRFAIAGDGEDAERLKALPQASDVTFPGFLAGAEKLAFFDDCFAMALPSASTKGDVEGLPVALLEAMASGKQVIASRDTNIKLLAEWSEISGIVEYLDDPSDVDAFARAIMRLLALDPEVAAQNAQVLARTAERYRWDNLIEEYLSVIDSVQHPGR